MISYPVVVVVVADNVAFLVVVFDDVGVILVCVVVFNDVNVPVVVVVASADVMVVFLRLLQLSRGSEQQCLLSYFVAIIVVDVVVRDGDQGLISSFNVVVVVPEDEGDGVQLWGYWEWHITMFSYLDRKHLFLNRRCPRCCFCCCDEHEAKSSVKVELLRFDVLA